MNRRKLLLGVASVALSASWFDRVLAQSALNSARRGARVPAPEVDVIGRALLFGDGVDGDLTISSGTTSLTQDMNYNNLTINGTGSLSLNGNVLRVAGILDLGNAPAGAIVAVTATNLPGNAASGATGGGTNAVVTPAGTAPRSGVGTAGGTGVAASSGTGTNQLSAVFVYGGDGGVGGAGGTSGTSVHAGAAAGTQANATKHPVASSILHAFPIYNGNNTSTGNNAQASNGGTGGGSGGGDGTNAGGGGGGGGGGGSGCIIYPRYIRRGPNTAAACISAKGGIGGAGANGVGGNAGGGGGGGGGAGGLIKIVVENLLGSTASNALDVTAGNGGVGGALAGTGSANGTGGAAGLGGQIAVHVLATGKVTYTAQGTAVATSPSVGVVTGGTATTVQQNL